MEPGLGERRGNMQILREVVLPFVGMTALWPMFRYASFVRVLYPAGTDIHLGGFALSAHTMFLVMMAVVTLACFARWRSVSSLLASRRLPGIVLISLASVASVLAAIAQSGHFTAGLLVLSIICAAVGFITSFLVWGSYFVRTWRTPSLVVLSSSFLASYLFFSAHGLVGSLAQGWIAACIMPLMSAFSWGLLPRATSFDDQDGTAFSVARCASPLVVAVASLLVVGGVVRGIVDMGRSSSVLRFQVSLVLSALLVALCVVYWRRRERRRALRDSNVSIRQGLGGHDSLSGFLAVCWAGVSLLFLFGLFLFLVMDDKHFGGDIVIVGRSSMEFILWAVLCNLAAAKRMPPVPVFLAGGMSFMVVSWFLSYVIIPACMSAEVYEGVLTAEAIVLAVMFGLVGVGLLVFGFSAMLRDMGDVPAPVSVSLDQFSLGEASEGLSCGDSGRSQEVALGPHASDRSLFDALMQRGCLTKKEAEVALLYSQGYSLGKVAEQLGMTKATAQSHIKGAYRKLDVHSRDELIEWTRQIG